MIGFMVVIVNWIKVFILDVIVEYQLNSYLFNFSMGYFQWECKIWMIG